MTDTDQALDGPLLTVEPDGAIHLRLASDPSVRLRRPDAAGLLTGLASREQSREMHLPATLHSRRIYGGVLDGRAMTLRVRPGDSYNTFVAFDGDTPVAGWDLDATAVSRLYVALTRALA